MTSADDQSSRTIVDVPTSAWEPGDPAFLALLEGTVQGEQTGPGKCRVWVERDDGEIVPVIWPYGYRARLDPLELLNASGAIVAVVGTAISVTGGFIPTEPSAQSDVDEAFHVMDELPVL